ncbi:MAG TPA: phosphatidate cytidylyltransferase [Rhizomicrobium sp.]|jgi:phosphatidate cytidylyltransferase|nr:phosphatidate cytidylyltransferase [Rhizomicrobium sp.]
MLDPSLIEIRLPFGLAPLVEARVLLWGLAGVLILLTAGALAAMLLPKLKPGKDYTNLRQRVNSWWVMVALLCVALLSGWLATTLLFLVISFIALREFLSLAPMRREDRYVILAAYLAAALNYYFIGIDSYGIYLVFIPVYCFLVAPFLMACIGQTKGYLATAATIQWGLMACVYSLGYAAFLMRTPVSEHLPAGPAGMVFLLLVATEANDVAQYVWGKFLGRHKITPAVSPNKTWEGFIGGWITTAALIWFAGPLFAPLEGAVRIWMALLLPLAGFAGDVTMSAIKRDIGVKDTSTLIPGHGGMLDRVDSMMFTAPLYFHLLAYFSLQRF